MQTQRETESELADIRCVQCNRKLAAGVFVRLQIKCRRCRKLNDFTGQKPNTTECHRVPNPTDRRHNEWTDHTTPNTTT